MKYEKITKNYAKALIESADSPEELSVIKDNFKNFVDFLNSDQDFRLFCLSPVIPYENKNIIIRDIFKNRLNDKFFDFIQLIFENGRENEVNDIYRKFCELVDLKMNILRVEATTAIPIKTNQISSLKNLLQERYKKEVVLENKIESSIIGGVILKIEDKIIDGSISGYLNQLVRSF